jgi:hypothetical protein
METLINNHIQNIFGCSSANYNKYPEIWIKNIELFIIVSIYLRLLQC